MSSYLMYMLSTTQDLQHFPHEPWNESITIYNYCPLLYKDKFLEDFRNVHDVFSKKLCFNMKSSLYHRLSLESQRIIQSFGSLYIQFPRFTHLRVGGFDEEPIDLPKFSLHCFVLEKVAQKLVIVINKFLAKDACDIIFPLKLGKLTCKSMEDAKCISSDLVKFGFGSYYWISLE